MARPVNSTRARIDEIIRTAPAPYENLSSKPAGGEIPQVPASNGDLAEFVSEPVGQQTMILANEDAINSKFLREAKLLQELQRSQEAQFEELARQKDQENLLAKKTEELRALIAFHLNTKLLDDNIKVGHVHVDTYAFPDNDRSVEKVLKAFIDKGWLIRITDDPSTSSDTSHGSFLKKVEIPLSK